MEPRPGAAPGGRGHLLGPSLPRVAEPHVSLDLHLDERKKGLEGGTGLGLGGHELPVLRLLEGQRELR